MNKPALFIQGIFSFYYPNENALLSESMAIFHIFASYATVTL